MVEIGDAQLTYSLEHKKHRGNEYLHTERATAEGLNTDAGV